MDRIYAFLLKVPYPPDKGGYGGLGDLGGLKDGKTPLRISP